MKFFVFGDANYSNFSNMLCTKPVGKQRLITGLTLLLLVDLIWVGSSELTVYIFKDQRYNKPYFTTYLKTTMFILYLSGFLFRKSWRKQCRWPKVLTSIGVLAMERNKNLSEPVYVPIKDDDDGYSSIDSNDADVPSSPGRKSVRFNDHSEVRTMTDSAEDANMARLSYQEFQRKQQEFQKLNRKFPVPVVCKLALIFCIMWFVANFSYQEALLNTQPCVVNALSSTSGLFTLILAAIWSSGPSDRFTLSKFIAVLISTGGMVLICLSDADALKHKVPIGTIWAVVSAMAYAIYLVTLKHKVKDDEKLDVPMFFGFVGLFNLLILWPGVLVFHYAKWETFQLPTLTDLLLLLANGLVGTVLSEMLWLWGCFLTSALTGTLALGLVTPLTMLFDIFIKKYTYSWKFYAGVAPVLISFIAVTVFSHYENWDPALLLFKKFTKCITRIIQTARLAEVESEQRERLITPNINDEV